MNSSDETQRAIPLSERTWSRAPSAESAIKKLLESPQLYKTYLDIINYSRGGEAVVMSRKEINIYLEALKAYIGETHFNTLWNSSLKKALKKFYAEA